MYTWSFKLKQASNEEKPVLHIHDSLELENEPSQRREHMYNTWGWHLEWTAIDNGDEYIMENKSMAVFEAYKLLRRPDLLR